MKKFLSILIVSAVLSGSVFANFFSNRIFEFVINAPVGLSNNTFAIFDYLKEDLVIDLNEMVKKMPENGFNISKNNDLIKCCYPKQIIFVNLVFLILL